MRQGLGPDEKLRCGPHLFISSRKEGEHCRKLPLDSSTVSWKADPEKDSGGTPSFHKSPLRPGVRIGATWVLGLEGRESPAWPGPQLVAATLSRRPFQSGPCPRAPAGTVVLCESWRCLLRHTRAGDAEQGVPLLHEGTRDENGARITRRCSAWEQAKLFHWSFPFFFRVISYEEGKALAESWNAAFLESSAKENQVRSFKNSLALHPPLTGTRSSQAPSPPVPPAWPRSRRCV